MARISNSVGTKGTNEVHDVAMVQLMLALLKNGNHGAYFPQPYTNPFGGDTTRAISAFQADKKLTGGEASTELPGLVAPGGATWNALNSAFTALGKKYSSLRTSNGVSVVYEPMPPPSIGEAETTVSRQTLQKDFQQQVFKLVRRCWERTQIAWSIVPTTGGWRSFADQEGKVSDAGFGETIHSYGYAVDLTVVNFKWVDPKLQVQSSQISFVGMDKALAKQFFLARNVFAKSFNLYTTIKGGDFYHLQAFDDSALDSVGSLMALLHKVGPRKMTWKPRYMTPTEYLCDLGLGGELYYVGTAKDIWKQDPNHHISKGDLVAALQAKLKSEPGFSVASFFGRKAGSKSTFKESDVGNEEIRAVQRILKAEFDAAAAKWREWRPVYYPTKERRSKNPKPH